MKTNRPTAFNLDFQKQALKYFHTMEKERPNYENQYADILKRINGSVGFIAWMFEHEASPVTGCIPNICGVFRLSVMSAVTIIHDLIGCYLETVVFTGKESEEVSKLLCLLLECIERRTPGTTNELIKIIKEHPTLKSAIENERD